MRKTLAFLLCLVLSFGIWSTVLADQPDTQPGTPEDGNLNTSGLLSYDELVKSLKKIEHNSQGQVKVEAVGTSNRGRTIHKATVGTGKQVVLITSQIHGNEPMGTIALVNLLQYLGSSNSPEAKKIREEITLVAVPQMNPDAAELERRGNDMTWAEVVEAFPQLADARPAWNYYTRTMQGHDYS